MLKTEVLSGFCHGTHAHFPTTITIWPYMVYGLLGSQMGQKIYEKALKTLSEYLVDCKDIPVCILCIRRTFIFRGKPLFFLASFWSIFYGPPKNKQISLRYSNNIYKKFSFLNSIGQNHPIQFFIGLKFWKNC